MELQTQHLFTKNNMATIKLSELPIAEIGNEIDKNCFHCIMDLNNKPIAVVPLENIYNHIKDKALKDGSLTVELTENKIIITPCHS